MDNFIYAIECENFIKIGFTNNVIRRAQDFSALSPFEFKIVRSVKYEAVHVRGNYYLKTAILVEKAIHNHLILLGYHHKGEWFKNIKEVVDIFDIFIKKYNPNVIFERTKMLLYISEKMPKNKKDFLRKTDEEFGSDRKYVVSKFRKIAMSDLDFLMSNNLERMQNLIGK